MTVHRSCSQCTLGLLCISKCGRGLGLLWRLHDAPHVSGVYVCYGIWSSLQCWRVYRPPPCKPSVEHCELGFHFLLCITSCEGVGLTHRGLVVAMECLPMIPRIGTWWEGRKWKAGVWELKRALCYGYENKQVVQSRPLKWLDTNNDNVTSKVHAFWSLDVLRLLCVCLQHPVIRNDCKSDALHWFLRILWAKLVDHILDGIVVVDFLWNQAFLFVIVVLHSEMEIAARMPFVKEYPNIMLYCFLDLIQFKL